MALVSPGRGALREIEAVSCHFLFGSVPAPTPPPPTCLRIKEDTTEFDTSVPQSFFPDAAFKASKKKKSLREIAMDQFSCHWRAQNGP